ncbi:polyprenyl synthetase family protein [Nocardioides dongkuii]|uniref:polyprenyl synthetase family protein n=1 Tax=Nocardioides dongkuii TaxID=2760089 RepID=UPI0015FBA5B5|nr:polyprenyl synthetase family protein [Nocardioides dongkuii]
MSDVRHPGTPGTPGPRDLDPVGLAAVDDLLTGRLAGHGTVLVDVSLELRPVVTALRDAIVGGKRLRAAFCLWGARGAAGADDVPGAAEAAAALELFHLAALVHDDLMDHSDARRGRPTVHRGFADEHRASGRLGDPDEHGAAVAVLAGDLCLTWSDDLLADGARASAYGDAARLVWSQMRDQVLAGQYLDVLGQTRAASTTAQVRRVLHYKSAKYTVEHPLLLGGTLGGAPSDLLDGYRALGLQVGEAFQLRDDVLGVFGEPDVTGKPAVDDVREGKRTLLVAYAEERAGRAGREVLGRHVGDPDLDERGLQAVREVLRDSGALDRVEERIAHLAAEAHAVLDDLPADDRVRRALAALTDACAWRIA